MILTGSSLAAEFLNPRQRQMLDVRRKKDEGQISARKLIGSGKIIVKSTDKEARGAASVVNFSCQDFMLRVPPNPD